MYKPVKIEVCLVNLLLEEYKQNCIYEDLKEKGIDIENLLIDNFEIVLDIIGFPREKTFKYDISKLDAIEIDIQTGEPMKEVYFERNHLYYAFEDVLGSIKKVQHIEVLDSGLKLKEY